MISVRALLGVTVAFGLGALGLVVGAGVGPTLAQSGENGFPASEEAPSTPQPSAKPTDVIPAKQLFGAIKQPAPITASAVGGYAGGCLAGARALPIDGRAWQAMRLSRNRNWGHPEMVRWVEDFATTAQQKDGWAGLLVGDMSQPRGGPMLTGHASHQIGLDADIWFTPMPNRRLSNTEREEMSAVSMLAKGELSVDPQLWDATRERIIKRAATSPQVERIFVHPAIKKALCESTKETGPERAWLAKVRPYWGHHYHFHVRIACPKDSANCKPQAATPTEDGCGAELTDWYKRITAPPKPVVGPPKPPPPPLTMANLPGECRVVLETGISKGIVRSSSAGSSAGGPTAAPAGQR